MHPPKSNRAADSPKLGGTRATDLLRTSAGQVISRSSGRLPRRRFIPLLAASIASLAGCGGEEQSVPGGYNFPGARKDETGNYKMRNI